MGIRRVVIRGISLFCVTLPILLGGCWEYASPAAQRRLESATRPIAVTVFPVRVVRGPVVDQDPALARKIAAILQEEGLGNANASSTPVEFPVRWHANEAKMAQESAESFTSRVKMANVGTDYALLVEMLCDPGETRVLAVRYYLAERDGTIAGGGLANSHWPEFQQVLPRDRNGGYEVLVRMLRKRFPPT